MHESTQRVHWEEDTVVGLMACAQHLHHGRFLLEYHKGITCGICIFKWNLHKNETIWWTILHLRLLWPINGVGAELAKVQLENV